MEGVGRDASQIEITLGSTYPITWRDDGGAVSPRHLDIKVGLEASITKWVAPLLTISAQVYKWIVDNARHAIRFVSSHRIEDRPH
jgi:hypothetical protein